MALNNLTTHRCVKNPLMQACLFSKLKEEEEEEEYMLSSASIILSYCTCGHTNEWLLLVSPLMIKNASSNSTMLLNWCCHISKASVNIRIYSFTIEVWYLLLNFISQCSWVMPMLVHIYNVTSKYKHRHYIVFTCLAQCTRLCIIYIF